VIEQDPDTSFEFWKFNVATDAERSGTKRQQTYAYELWIIQEAQWTATIEGFDDYDEFGDTFNF